jgi:quercetin dioxygenase-like cupin family protein
MAEPRIETTAVEELDGKPHAVAFPDVEPRTIRLELDEGERIDSHEHPGRHVVLFVLEGRLDLSVGDERRELVAGDLARFDGDHEISPEAIETSAALIVLSPAATDRT